MSILRDYQRQALAAFWAELSPDVNRVAIEMATGLGKTITFAAAIDEWLDGGKGAYIGEGSAWRYQRALVLVHTDELVQQAVAKILALTRGRWTVGVVKAGQNEVSKDIVVASIQTLANPDRRGQIADVGFIVVDECHHAVAKTYVDILEHFNALDMSNNLQYDAGHDSSGIREHVRETGSQEGVGVAGAGSVKGIGTTGQSQRGSGAGRGDALHEQGGRGRRNVLTPVLGVSATLARTDRRGLGHAWQAMPFSRSLPWGIRKGYLIDLVPYTITIPGLDAGASDQALDVQLADSIAPEAVVETWLKKAGMWGPSDDPSTVLFAPLVQSAEAFADAFNAAGVKAEVVHGKLSRPERQAILDRYEAGTTTVVCNAMVLTEGWDSPRTMCVIVARPTQSVPLFVQMVGRGMRPWLASEAPAREEQRCVLLCVQGTVGQLATVADLSENIGQAQDGVSLLAMEDQWDLGQDIENDAPAYSGPVRVEAWDAIVQASSKAWQYTTGGTPFLPTAKRGQGYVFCVQDGQEWSVWSRLASPNGTGLVHREATAPDLELAMAMAEDIAQDLGGDIGALLADKTRAWRKGVPSAELQGLAQLLGLGKELIGIMEQRASGKAGKLSDLVSKVQASKTIDPVIEKIKERGASNA